MRKPQFGLAKAFAFGLLASTAAAPVRAQETTPYAKINAATAVADVKTVPLRGGVSLLDGAGGNVAVLASDRSMLLVDAGIAISRAKMESALHALGSQAPTKLIVTHWHWDHSDGDGWANADGAEIIAHPNTARHLSETIRVEEWGHTFTPVEPRARPTRLIGKATTLRVGNELVDVRPYVASHTDGDLSVYFRKADVLATGDTWWNGIYPFIDYVAGGSIDGMISAANANLEMAKDRTIVIPGHGPAGGRKELATFRDMLVAIRTRVAALKANGLTLAQVQAEQPTKDYDAIWGGGVIDPTLFTALVFRGIP